MRLEAWKLRLMSCVEFIVEFGLLPSLSAVRVPERGTERDTSFPAWSFLSVEKKLTGTMTEGVNCGLNANLARGAKS